MKNMLVLYGYHPDWKNIYDTNMLKSELRGIIDDVIIFNTDTDLTDILYLYQPDVLVIGEEYKSKNIIGSEHAKRIDFFEKKYDISTTAILNNKNK